MPVQQPVSLGAAQSRMLAVRLQAPVDEAAGGAKRELHPIHFTVEAVDDPQVVRHEKSTFIIPH